MRRYEWRRAGEGEAADLIEAVNGQVRPSPLDVQTTQVWTAELRFYADTRLVALVDQSRAAPNRRLALFPRHGEPVLLDHSNGPIYRHNAQHGVRIDADNAAAYAAFFFDHVAAAQGRFLIVESGKDLAWLDDADPAEVAAAALEIRPLQYRGVQGGTIWLTASMVFKTSLFHADICIAANGRVVMRDEALRVERLPIRPDCTAATDPFHAPSEGQLY